MQGLVPVPTRSLPPQRNAMLKINISDTKLYDDLDELATFLAIVFPHASINKWRVYRRLRLQ